MYISYLQRLCHGKPGWLLRSERHPIQSLWHFLLACVQRSLLWLCWCLLQRPNEALSRESHWNKSCLGYFCCCCSFRWCCAQLRFQSLLSMKPFYATLELHLWYALVAASLRGEHQSAVRCVSFFFFVAACTRWATFSLCASAHLFAQHCPWVVAILS